MRGIGKQINILQEEGLPNLGQAKQVGGGGASEEFRADKIQNTDLEIVRDIFHTSTLS